MLEKIWCVLRMGSDKLAKARMLGWYEVRSKIIGRKKKTVVETMVAGVVVTDVEQMVADRKEKVEGRMDHLYKWKYQRGKRCEWG